MGCAGRTGAGLAYLLKYASQFVLDLSIAGVVIVATCLTVVPAIPRNPSQKLQLALFRTGALVSSIGGPPLAPYTEMPVAVLYALSQQFYTWLGSNHRARVAGDHWRERPKIALTLLPAVGFGFC